jgi:hypothetical protein
MENRRLIRLLSTLVRYCCLAGMMCILPLAALSWVMKSPPSTLLSLVENILFLPIFFLVAKLLKRYEKDDFFSKTHTRYIRQIALFLFFSQCGATLSRYCLGPADLTFLAFVLQSVEFKLIFLSFVIFLLGQVMEEGERLQDDYNQTI